VTAGPQDERAHSSIGEAVQQTAAATRLWTDALSRFAVEEADRIASDTYGLADLLTCPVRWWRVVTDAASRTLPLLPDNVALLAAGTKAAVRQPRVAEVDLDVAAMPGVALVASALTGLRTTETIAAARIRVVPALAGTRRSR
jgi:hypothetical protein